MPEDNAPRWDGGPGFYEVWYLTLTDRASGVGLWIRYTLLAPAAGRGGPTASLWFFAMEPGTEPIGRKHTVDAAAEASFAADPFAVRIAGAELDDRRASGAFADVAWDLGWSADGGSHRHVHPLLEHARIARTVLTLPHGDLEVSGTVTLPGGRRLELDRTRAGQAHLWGTKHAQRWAWLHCNDWEDERGEPVPGEVIDAVSVFVGRLGREVGPSTPVVGRVGNAPFCSVSPLRVLANSSRFGLSSWELEASAGGRSVRAEVEAPRESLAGVTYEDPDGDRAYCFNSEIATARLHVREGGQHVRTLRAPGRAHFEYAQRQPVAGVPLLV